MGGSDKVGFVRFVRPFVRSSVPPSFLPPSLSSVRVSGSVRGHRALALSAAAAIRVVLVSPDSASERGGANGSHAPPPPPLTLMFLGSEMDDAKKGECHGWCW